ncbi:type VI secretion system ATPase TssH [Pseudoalteromonas sp. C2R02]|uniref:type VI secretion system ATPase TssH n=1 Tax=Pseudoalteromonas sp. C2R02 TaxID=2841565 RepID=UPI001C0997A9|nr:type VI secretion system ATPase TssH [Pseudoalteromonas sp. C2R02]MBU2968402.1 type VI secretion system ATPase TssH [Pseudoalteromonas sp. C2R02]
MSSMSLSKLVDKLNPVVKKSLEGAASICHSRSQFTVEVEHWLLSLLEKEADDIRLILASFSIDKDALVDELLKSLELQKTGNSAAPSLSPHIVNWLRQTWLNTSIEFNDIQIRSAYLLYTLLSDDTLSSLVIRKVRQLEKIVPAQLLHAWPELVNKTNEVNNAQLGSGIAQDTKSSPSKTPSLDQFTQNLTEQALAGKIDPILGRDNEIRQMIDILTRRRQNNPILTGEAGVGKTAVVEGLALKIAHKDVPDSLKDVTIHVLDLALLQAGAGMKGEFENRLKSLINEVKNAASPIILFIDEAHTMIGSGGQAGQNDAANLLKPALARGELRTIAATTWAEYKKFFEKDAALARRFQVVKVEEPTEDQAVVMMRGLLPVMENHHKVSISDQALQSSVALSHRYINGRQLPDKAVGLLDTACARVAMSQAATPGNVEQLQRKIQQLETQIAVLTREQTIGTDHKFQVNELSNELLQAQQDLVPLNTQWQLELSLVKEVAQIVNTLYTKENEDTEGLLNRLHECKSQLNEAETPMVHWQVDEQVIAEIISDWTGIPVGKMQEDEINTILSLQENMEKRVIGQSDAIAQIAKTVQTSRAQLGDENRPIGVFMLAGPSGVGKTETALTLAENIYGSEENVTVINMSEYKEEHKVSLLLGSPPGYVGYGEGGVLTEAVRRKPYSVVLLDEMEKAHPGVQDIFYQVFDKGTIKDGEGRDIDFKNTIIIMTSNVGTNTTMNLYADEETIPSPKGLRKALQDDLLEVFKPAFLGRINVLPYIPLSTQMLNEITALQLARVGVRMQNNYDAQFEYSTDVLDKIVQMCDDAGSGARNIHNILQNTILPELSTQLLVKMAKKEKTQQVQVNVVNEKFNYSV